MKLPVNKRKSAADKEDDQFFSRVREERHIANAVLNRVHGAVSTYLKANPEGAESAGVIATLDLHAAGCSVADIAERLHVTRDKVRSWLASGQSVMAQRAAVSAEVIRTQANARLEGLYSDLAAMRSSGELDQSASIRAIEVQARILSQQTDLYAAKVREGDADMADAVQSLLRDATLLDREGIGANQPAALVLVTDRDS